VSIHNQNHTWAHSSGRRRLSQKKYLGRGVMVSFFSFEQLFLFRLIIADKTYVHLPSPDPNSRKHTTRYRLYSCSLSLPPRTISGRSRLFLLDMMLVEVGSCCIFYFFIGDPPTTTPPIPERMMICYIYSVLFGDPPPRGTALGRFPDTDTVIAECTSEPVMTAPRASTKPRLWRTGVVSEV